MVFSFFLLAREKKTGFYHPIVSTGWFIVNNSLFPSLENQNVRFTKKVQNLENMCWFYGHCSVTVLFDEINDFS